MVQWLRVSALVILAVTASTLASGCGVRIPADPDGTLDRVRGGVLRVGVSATPPWTSPATGGEPRGLEVDLVRDFAASLGARAEWHGGGEEYLVGELERGALDLVIGGITAATPWAHKAAVTRPYLTVRGPEGKPEEHVMLAPLGENAFLVTLERFLLGADVRP